MPMTEKQHSEKVRQVTQAADVEDLLSHVGWRDVIQPVLKEHKESLYKMLQHTTLGYPQDYDTKGNPLTPMHIAGRIYGIEWFETMLGRILATGEHAKKVLTSTED